jgi:hypothetical protein
MLLSIEPKRSSMEAESAEKESWSVRWSAFNTGSSNTQHKREAFGSKLEQLGLICVRNTIASFVEQLQHNRAIRHMAGRRKSSSQYV